MRLLGRNEYEIRRAQPDADFVAVPAPGSGPRMKNWSPLARTDGHDEVSALIERLAETEGRLEELTGGEVDTVTNRAGRTFLMRRAQSQLPQSDAAGQAAILNALPAHIA